MPLCHEGSFCVECETDDQCFQPGYCGGWSCISSCTTDQDCKNPEKPVCRPEISTCVQCKTGADCIAQDPSRPYCVSNQCGSCKTSFECDNGNQSCLLDSAGYGECGFPAIGCANSVYQAAPLTPAQAKLVGNVFPMVLSKIILEEGTCVDLGQYAWHMVEVKEGDTLKIELSWDQGFPWRTYRVALFSEAGELLGESPYGFPQTLSVHHLPAGNHFVRIEGFETPDTQNVYLYKLVLFRSPGGCKQDDDCAFFSTSQTYRARCTPTGSCAFLEAPGTVAQGGLCDHTSDCAPGLICSAERQSYVKDADQRSICTVPCTKDTDCPASLLCSDVLPTDEIYALCLPPCSEQEQCSVVPWQDPPQVTAPWFRMACKNEHCSYWAQ